MSATAITNAKLKLNEGTAMPTAVAADATDGALVDYTGREDGRILLLLENSGTSAATATIKAGNALQGTEDLAVSIAGSGTSVVTVESGKFVNVYGPNKGKLQVTGTGVKVAAIELP